MSLFDMFKTQAPAQPSAQAPVPASPQPAAPAPEKPNEPVNPLDAYAKLFSKAENQTPDEAPKFSLDPKTLNEVSSKFDFTQGLDPQLVQKASQGDAQSLIAMMQHVGQSAYKAALSHGSVLTDQFVGARTAHEMKGVSGIVRNELTQGALASTPNYSHPVVKEQLNKTAEAFRAQYPDAAPQEIAKMASDYIQVLANAINPAASTQKTEPSEGTDWTKYLTNS